MIASQGADLRVCVELRGFEPLTPSMRTRCATGLRYSPKTGSQRSKHPHQPGRQRGPSATRDRAADLARPSSRPGQADDQPASGASQSPTAN